MQRFRDEYDQALRSYEAVLDLYRAVGDRLGEANTLRGLGNLKLAGGREKEALDLLEQALDLHRRVGDHVGQTNIYWDLGLHFVQQDALEKAEPFLAQAVDLSRQIAPDHPFTRQIETKLNEVRKQLGRSDQDET